MPLTDFGIFGNLDEIGYFQPNDIKALKNQKWIEKVKSNFAKSPFNFNVYIFHYTKGIILETFEDYEKTIVIQLIR